MFLILNNVFLDAHPEENRDRSVSDRSNPARIRQKPAKKLQAAAGCIYGQKNTLSRAGLTRKDQMQPNRHSGHRTKKGRLIQVWQIDLDNRQRGKGRPGRQAGLTRLTTKLQWVRGTTKATKVVSRHPVVLLKIKETAQKVAQALAVDGPSRRQILRRHCRRKDARAQADGWAGAGAGLSRRARGQSVPAAPNKQ